MQRRSPNLTALVAGIVFVVLGALFLLQRLGFIEVSGRFVVPVVLVALGFAIIAGGRHDHRETPDSHPPPPPPPPGV